MLVLAWAVLVFASRHGVAVAAQPAERHRHRGHPHRSRLLRPALARPWPPAGPPGLPAAGGQPPGGDGRPHGRRARARRWPASGPRARPSASSSARSWRRPTPAGRRCGPGPAARARPLLGARGAGWRRVRPDRAARRPAAPCGARSCSTWWWPRCRSPWWRCCRTSTCSSSGATTRRTAAPTPPCRSRARPSSSAPSCSAGYLLPEAAIRWRQGGHALRQLAVVLVLLAVPSVLLLGVALAAPGAAPRDRLPPRLHVGRRRARPAGAGHDHAERLGRADHVPAGRRPALGGGRARGAAPSRSRWPCSAVHGAPRATAFVDLAVQAGVLLVIVVRVRGGPQGPACEAGRQG